MPLQKELQFTFKSKSQQKVRIRIGDFASVGIQDYLGSVATDKIFIICDQKLIHSHGNTVYQLLYKKYPVHLIAYTSSEQNKNLMSAESIVEEILENGGTPQSCVCSVGGGVVGNIAGFVASILFRGIELIHIPTTLLAQLDSAVDVKQSVNSRGIKNSIGTYKAPGFVFINPQFLLTLSDRELRSGLGEALKHAFAQDITFIPNVLSVDTQDLHALTELIAHTISLKLQHWEQTPNIWSKHDKKIERLTHLGHTTGRILESIELGLLTHGEAIAHGMVIEAYASNQLGYLDYNSVNFMRDSLQEAALLPKLPASYGPDEILARLYPVSILYKPIFAVLKRLGDPDVLSTTIPKQLMRKALLWYLQANPQ
jgi:3-dehydroquinate synthetase